MVKAIRQVLDNLKKLITKQTKANNCNKSNEKKKLWPGCKIIDHDKNRTVQDKKPSIMREKKITECEPKQRDINTKGRKEVLAYVSACVFVCVMSI